MEELKIDEKLSPQAYWDEVLKKAQLPRVNSPRSYHYKVTMDYVDDCIRRKKYATFFEVGCGSSGWLPYFARKYGLRVSGIDYSSVGCRLAEENLRMLNIDYGEIFCRDLFESDCTDGKTYDIVFSYGVIEHFEKPEEVVRIFSTFLRPGGLIITLVPNLNGLMGSLTEGVVPDIYAMHRVITAEQLRSFHEKEGLSILKNGYAGTLALAIVPMVHSKRWLFREGTWRRRMTLFVVGSIDKVISRLCIWWRINLASRRFSPYVICVAEKNRDA